MRLFAGLEISPAVIASLSHLLSALRPGTPLLQWSPPANFHITTKFIGDLPDAQLDQVVSTLAQIPVPEPFSMAIAGLGYFPHAQAPRVLYAGVEAPEHLAQLARDTDEALARLGVPRETRAYSPHLTLARTKTPRDLAPIRELIDRNTSTHFGSVDVTAFHLYESRPGPQGSVYRILASFPLTKAKGVH